MDITYFAQGLAIGFAIAAPVGPIGLLCIWRTLANGRLAGFVSGMGAATADACFGAVAALGLTAISSALVTHQSAVRLVGGVFLCYLGARTALTHPAMESKVGTVRSLAAAFGSTLALTLTNPTTILSFVAVFAGLGLGTINRRPGIVGAHGLRRVPRVRALVAPAQWWGRVLPASTDGGAPALGEPALRGSAHRVWRSLAAQSHPIDNRLSDTKDTEASTMFRRPRSSAHPAAWPVHW